MAFVKLDCGILNSTIWVDRPARETFLTALLLAQPKEVTEPMATLKVDSLEKDDFFVPVGWYGFVPAAGTGILRMAGIDRDIGMDALKRLASPEQESRTPDHEGRRMVRVDGGYIILNFDKYRQKDHTSSERSRRYRDKQKGVTTVASRVATVASRVTDRSVTQAEAEAEAEAEKREEKREPLPKKPRKPKSAPQTDEEWLSSLCLAPENKGVDVRNEYKRMHEWCSKKNETPSRRRFAKWLERADRPLSKPAFDPTMPNLPDSGKSMFDLSLTDGVLNPNFPYHLSK